MRPKVGDRVEFKAFGMARIGTVTAVAETGVHFLIESPELRQKYKKTGISAIVRILPG